MSRALLQGATRYLLPRCWSHAKGREAKSKMVTRKISNAPKIPKNQSDLVELLRRRNVLVSPAVEEAMLKVDRGNYASSVFSGSPPYLAYMDEPIPIGQSQTISAPSVHAICLELLEPFLGKGACALDVGSGSGYVAACMAYMVGKEGKVLGVEKHQILMEQSLRNIRATNSEVLPGGAIGSLDIVGGNIYQQTEFLKDKLFDAIHVGAAAEQVPPILLEKLKPGGRLVIPIGAPGRIQILTVLDKDKEGNWSRMDGTEVRYVPLTKPEADKIWP